MDGGPFRVSRPTERRAANRTEPTHRQPDQPQPDETPQASRPTATSVRPITSTVGSSRRGGLWLIIFTILAVIAVAIGGWYVWTNTRSTAVAIDSDTYQAVFFTNGQVYFGKLQQANQDYLKLTDIYYLQTQSGGTSDAENPQETSTDQNNVQLIKLGDEIHGPEDMMMIAKGQVVFYENLKTDGKVAQSIAKYKKP